VTFQAYMDTIYAKTGMKPEQFKALAEEKGLATHAAIVSWLTTEYSLGIGHARALVVVILHEEDGATPLEDHVAKHFTGGKARWKAAYDALFAEVSGFGPDVTAAPGSTYISLLRGAKKFAVVQVTANRLDLGIKLKGAPAEGRFEEAGAWNSMVTHRVRIDDPAQLDAEVIARLCQAYDKAA
jgi:hypothetical protein